MAQSRADFLAGLKARRDALDQAIKSLEQLEAVERQYGTTEPAPGSHSVGTVIAGQTASTRPALALTEIAGLPMDPLGLRKMRLTEAILTIMRHHVYPMTNQQIADELKKVRYPSESINMPNNVGTALNRLKGNVVDRVANSWKLRAEASLL